jgi:hypothetical protein
VQKERYTKLHSHNHAETTKNNLTAILPSIIFPNNSVNAMACFVASVPEPSDEAWEKVASTPKLVTHARLNEVSRMDYHVN